MKIYIVQFRVNHTSHLLPLGIFRARSAAGAIRQAAQQLTAGGEDAVEIIATETENRHE